MAGRSHYGGGSGGDAGANAAAVAQMISRLTDVLGPVLKTIFTKAGEAAGRAKAAFTSGVAGATGATGTGDAGQPAPQAPPAAGGVMGFLGGAMKLMNSAGGQQAATGISGHLQQMAMMQPGGGFGTNLLAGILPNVGKFAGPWGEVAGSALSLFLKNRAAQKQQQEMMQAAAGGGIPDPTGGDGGLVSSGINTVNRGIATFNRTADRTQSHVQDFNPESVRQYQKALRDLNAVFGRMLLPSMELFKSVVKEVGASLNPLTPVVKGLFQSVTETIKPFISMGGGVLRQLGSAISPAIEALSKVVPVIGTALKPLAQLAGGVLSTAASQVGRLVEQFSGWLPKAVAGLTAMLDKFRPALEGIGKAFNEIMQAVGDSASTAFGSALESIGLAMKALTPLFDGFALTLKGMAKIIEWTARGIAKVIEMHNRVAHLLGYSGVEARGPLERRSADGLAAQGTSTTSVGAMLQQLRERAFAMGGDGQNDRGKPTEKDMPNLLSQLVEYVREKLAKEVGKAVYDNLPDGLKSAADSAGGAVDKLRSRGSDARELLRAVVPVYGWSGM